jgi:DNA repair exonuclease SbcCD ATPase subunit
LEAELAANQSAVVQFSELLKTVKARKNEWERDNAIMVGKAKVDIKHLTAQVSGLHERILELTADHGLAVAELNLTVERLEDHRLDLESLKRSHGKMVVLRDRATDELRKIGVGNVCPTCGQRVLRENLVGHIRELEALVNDPRLVELSNDIDVVEDAVRGTSEIWQEQSRQVAELLGEINRLNGLKVGVSGELTVAERWLEKWSSDVNPYIDQLVDVRDLLRGSKEKVKILQEDLAKLLRRLGRVKFWVNGFKACRLYLLEEVLSELRLVSNAICPELGLDGWVIDYQVERETKVGSIKRGLDVTIVSPGSDKPVRWESFSGGEQQRLRLIGALSLSEVLLNHAGIQSDLEVLDEPTRHLSSQGIRDLCESLPDRSIRLGRRTFYTDHTAVESTYFASVLTIVRRIDGSIVER